MTFKGKRRIMDPYWEMIFSEVRNWGRKKGINNYSTQMNKMIEEQGELASELNHERLDSPELIDAFGDVFITFIILADILNVDLYQALCIAFDEVSVRTGRTHNGNFIKSENQKDD